MPEPTDTTIGETSLSAQLDLKFVLLDSIEEADLLLEKIKKAILFKHPLDLDIKEGITTHISARKITFETLAHVEPDKFCRVEILFSAGDGLAAAARIIKVSEFEVSGEKIFQIELEPLNPDKIFINKIHHWYNIYQQSGTNIAQRKDKRIKVEHAFIKYRRKKLLKWSDWEIGKILNISSGGLLFRPNKKNIKPKETLSILITIISDGTKIDALGKVVRIKTVPLEKEIDVGLVLSELNSADQKKWANLCKKFSEDRKDENIFWF